MGISTVQTSTQDTYCQIGQRSFLSFFQKCKYKSIILFLQPNTNTRITSTMKIHPWDMFPDQAKIVSLVIKNTFADTFLRTKYSCRLSAQHKICCQIVQKSFFLEPVKDIELTSTIYPISFHLVFLFLLQVTLVGDDLKD